MMHLAPAKKKGVLLIVFFRVALALQSSSTASSAKSTSLPLLDVDRLRRTIARGRVYQHENFLVDEEVQIVLKEVKEMESKNKFQRKGLSNTVLGQNQTFDAKLDRSICPVPWFQDALEGKDTRVIPDRLRQLQLFLSQILDRPTMASTTSGHECYYSKSEVGSRLPRHMDERHEETKGAKGWLAPTRRSLSWLIYLSTPSDWTLEENGGALRTYPQKLVEYAPSTHDGNLQVGWLVGDGKTIPTSQAVYLDSWHPVIGVVAEGIVPEPHCVLYKVNEDGEKQVLTQPWLTEQLQGLAQMDFMKLCAEHDASDILNEAPLLFLKSAYAKAFSPLEDRAAWDAGQDPSGSETEDIVPLRGSLVVFDSVQLPHQVEIIGSGTRMALAGWFHENTQEFPESFFGSLA